eukprot:CAMPEP_0115005054 /NCGR_PEP_ID=MMETSP0216-20121206/19622_1 /TAXON_ID=223996 /ORGANISM="Protocruzia adherens, Strain Boccale" /LENGTH=201 /DNA_ID=CAMNT_0002371265 /DNA_START=690 /DNA_END=1295 /DNA_ORIENTATION=+
MIITISTFSAASGNQASFLRFKQQTKTNVVNRNGAWALRGRTVNSFCYRKHKDAKHVSLGIAVNGSTQCVILDLVIASGADYYATTNTPYYQFVVDTDLTKCTCTDSTRRFRPLANPTVATLTLNDVINTVNTYDGALAHQYYRMNTNNCVHFASYVWNQHVTGNGGFSDHAIKCEVMANYDQSRFYIDFIDPTGTGVPHC